MDWHHVVNKFPSNILKFGTEAIHNIRNLIPVPRQVHEQISAYYSSIREFTGNLIVRDWLKTQSFEAQYEFGLGVLRMFGVIK
jgi:hypothetical protein